MVILFHAKNCALDGVCRTWGPALLDRYGGDLIDVVDAHVPPILREEAPSAFAMAAVSGHNPNKEITQAPTQVSKRRKTQDPSQKESYPHQP